MFQLYEDGLNSENQTITNGLFQKNIHTPLTDGVLEILMGHGVKDSGNTGRRGGGVNMKKSSGVVISTDNSRDLNIYFGGHLLDGLCGFSI